VTHVTVVSMDLNIRNVPEEVLRGVRVKAAEGGMTIREYVLRALAESTGDRRLVVREEPYIAEEVTREEGEKDRRKRAKQERHEQLKADAQAAVEAEGIPPAFIEKVNTPAVGHHRNCSCFRCRPPKRGK
jgi:hypothetical protein